MFKENKNRGFTIIEVALVLAIGALIFLVVFLAVPAMQRNQRDNARKRDVTNVANAVSAWIANNPAKRFPANTNVNVYRQDLSDQPSTTHEIGNYIDKLSTYTEIVGVYGHNKTVADNGVDTTNDGIPMVWPGAIDVYFGYKCDGLNRIKRASSANAVIVAQIEAGNRYFEENSHNKEHRNYYCVDVS